MPLPIVAPHVQSRYQKPEKVRNAQNLYLLLTGQIYGRQHDHEAASDVWPAPPEQSGQTAGTQVYLAGP